jgi:hypothetical protein
MPGTYGKAFRKEEGRCPEGGTMFTGVYFICRFQRRDSRVPALIVSVGGCALGLHSCRLQDASRWLLDSFPEGAIG